MPLTWACRVTDTSLTGSTGFTGFCRFARMYRLALQSALLPEHTHARLRIQASTALLTYAPISHTTTHLLINVGAFIQLYHQLFITPCNGRLSTLPLPQELHKLAGFGVQVCLSLGHTRQQWKAQQTTV